MLKQLAYQQLTAFPGGSQSHRRAVFRRRLLASVSRPFQRTCPASSSTQWRHPLQPRSINCTPTWLESPLNTESNSNSCCRRSVACRHRLPG